MSWEQFIHNNFLMKLLAATIELVIGFFLGPAVKRLILRLHNRKGVDEGVLTFTGSLANILIRIIAIIIALGQIGVDMSVAVGAFSALGLGISLALKDNMSNVASGLQILITKPFKVGDYIACNDCEGTVVSIEIMFTTLETFDNQEVVIPNTVLISNSITNYSSYPSRRLVIKVPVSLFVDPKEFRSEAQKAMEACPYVLKDPKPKTQIGDYLADGSGMEINLVCYSTIEQFWDMKFALQEEIQKIRSSLALAAPTDVITISSAPAGVKETKGN